MTDFSLVGEETEEEDFYALFNLQRDANLDDITKAYRRLSMLYHPDRHVESDLKEDAERLFRKVQKAYDILKDPQKRYIYDTVGVKGLEIQGWELIERGIGPEEVKAEYERLKRIREEQMLQERVNPNTNVEIEIDATEVFRTATVEDEMDLNFKELRESWSEKVEFIGASIESSVEAPLTPADRLLLTGGVSAKNGVGDFNIIAGLRKHNILGLPAWGITQVGFGDKGNFGTSKLVYNISKHLMGTVQLTLAQREESIAPGLTTSIETQLDPRTSGVIQLSFGIQNALLIRITRHDTKRLNFISGAIILSRSGSHFAVEGTRKFPEDGGNMKATAKIGVFGAILGFNYLVRISDYNKIGASCHLHIPRGTVSVKLKLQRAQQAFTTKIHLCEEPEFFGVSVFYGVIVPFAVSQLAVIFIRPWLKTLRTKSDSKGDLEARKLLEERRKDSEIAIQLMRDTARRSKETEEKNKGLVVLEGWYGRLVSEAGAPSGGDIVDVSIPLQVLVKDSKIILHESRKSQIAGFYDPCPGVTKKLRVVYKFRGYLHSVTIEDHEPLLIPKQSHALSQNGNAH